MHNGKKVILGVHSGHDASAALLLDYTLLMAISKERLTRKKHDSGDPLVAIEYLLKNSGINYEDVDLVVRSNWFDSKELDDSYYTRFKRVIVTYEHHFLHALSSYSTSKHNEEICLVIDGRGSRQQDMNEESLFYVKNGTQFETESAYHFQGSTCVELDKKFSHHIKDRYSFGSYVNSVGYAYGFISKIVFKSAHDAGKIMALASYGSENYDIPDSFIYDDKFFSINGEWLNSLEVIKKVPWDTELAKDLSFHIQRDLEKYYEYRLRNLATQYGIHSFSLSGGVALNCKNNGRLANLEFVNSLHVFNACGDDGLSIGACVYGLMQLEGKIHKISWNYAPGFDYHSSARHYDVDINHVVELLKNQEIVAIFQHGSEFGPRALGHRSILASPVDIAMKDKINLTIKHREPFRPFGGSILRSKLKKLSNDRYASDYMLSAFNIDPSVATCIQAVMHIDGTSRLHIIDNEHSLLGKILVEFENQTGIPVLINTSFNGENEPIVESYVDAMNTCRNNNIHYLLTPNKLVRIDHE